jgi:alpha-L-fucosidase
MTEKTLSYAQEFGDWIRSINEKPLADTKGMGSSITLELADVGKVDHVVIMEDLHEGQKIAEYIIEAQNSKGQWIKICKGESIGHKRIERFKPIKTKKIRFNCIRSFADPINIRHFSAIHLGSNGILNKLKSIFLK